MVSLCLPNANARNHATTPFDLYQTRLRRPGRRSTTSQDDLPDYSAIAGRGGSAPREDSGGQHRTDQRRYEGGKHVLLYGEEAYHLCVKELSLATAVGSDKIVPPDVQFEVITQRLL